MAVLKHRHKSAAILAGLFWVSGVRAATIPPSFSLPSEALLALDRCAFGQAPMWAKQVEKTAPSLAMVYRLAWLQKQRSEVLVPKKNPPKRSLLWKSENEIWRDEWPLRLGVWECGGPDRPLSFSEIDERLLTEQMEGPKARYFSLSVPVKNLVQEYLAFLKAQDQEIGVLPSPDAKDCDSLIIDDKNTVIPGFTRQCADRKGRLWSMAYSRAGDAAVERRDFKEAFTAFGSAAKALGNQKVPAALWYRIAVAAHLAKQKEDFVFRAVQQATGDKEGVPPVYRAALYSQVCDRVEQFSPPALQKLLQRVFTAEERLRFSAALAKECGSRASRWIALLLKEKLSLPQRFALLGALLESEDWNGVVAPSVRSLAKLSHSYPAQASQHFWSALRKSHFTSQALRVYRKHGQWQSVDELRQKAWLAQKAESPRFHGLKVEEGQGKTLRASLSLSPFPIEWGPIPPVDFVALLKECLEHGTL